MKTLNLLLTVLLLVCLQQVKVANSKKTLSTKETVGQVLDKKFFLLKTEFQQSLRQIEYNLNKKVNKITKDIKTLKLIHGK